MTRAQLLAPTVWAPGRFRKGDLYGWFVRAVLPLVDGAFIYVGLGGLFNSIPALNEVYDTYQVDLIAGTFAVTGFMCLVGVVYPRLWPVEVVGKAFTLASIAVFTGVLGVLGGPRTYVVGFMLVPIILLTFRLLTMTQDWKRDPMRARETAARRAKRAARREARRG